MSSEGKIALITGITGQDGSYLAELLLGKGYTVRLDSELFLCPHLESKPHTLRLVCCRFTELCAVLRASTPAASITCTETVTIPE